MAVYSKVSCCSKYESKTYLIVSHTATNFRPYQWFVCYVELQQILSEEYLQKLIPELKNFEYVLVNKLDFENNGLTKDLPIKNGIYLQFIPTNEYEQLKGATEIIKKIINKLSKEE